MLGGRNEIVLISITTFVQDEQQNKSAEQSYLIEQIDYPFINECGADTQQQHFQYGGGSVSAHSEHAMQPYGRETADRMFNVGESKTFYRQGSIQSFFFF